MTEPISRTNEQASLQVSAGRPSSFTSQSVPATPILSRAFRAPSPAEVRRVQASLCLQPAEVREGAADALDQWGARHRPQVALQGCVVEVVGNGDLPLPKGNQPLCRRIHFAQGF